MGPNKLGSARLANSNGGLGRHQSDARLPVLQAKHSSSVGNFKDLGVDNQGRNLSRPSAVPPVMETRDSGSLPKIGDNRGMKSSASQPTKVFTRMIRVKNEEKDEAPNEDEDFLKPCPLGCGRKFGEENLEKHMKICQKVFTGKRDQYDSSKKRWAKMFKKKGE
jgi:hypothetical protein